MPRGGKRENAGSGGAREGAGRPRVRWNSGGPGTIWNAEVTKPGDVAPTQQWAVLSIDPDGTIEFQNLQTEEIIVLSRPDDQQID